MSELNGRTELQVFNAKYERENARERMQDAINTLNRAKEDLQRCMANFDDAENDRERARQVNYAINYLVTNIQPNIRIDLLAHSQAELTRTGV
jgi:hypothetical protein